MKLIVIAGHPRSGKSTLAREIAEQQQLLYRGTDPDDLLEDYGRKFEWSEASEFVSRWFDEERDHVIDGVATVRALRKWLLRNVGQPFPGTVHWMDKHVMELNPGQVVMAKGCDTVMRQILPALKNAGVDLVFHR